MNIFDVMNSVLRIFQCKCYDCYPNVNKYLHTIYLGISRSSQFFALASFSFTVFSSSCCIFCNVLIRLRKHVFELPQNSYITKDVSYRKKHLCLLNYYTSECI